MSMRTRLIALAASFVASISCGGKPAIIEVTLLDTCHLRADSCDGSVPTPAERAFCGDAFCANTAELATLAVFANGCPPDDTLREGDMSAAIRVVHAETGGPLPPIGELDAALFGFAGWLRAPDCSVVGFGCTEADLSTIRKVRIEIAPAEGRGACQPPEICQEGSCVAAPGGDEASCHPVLVSTGELPPRGEVGSLLSGPGIVATNSGYLIGYREDSPASANANQARIRIAPIDKDGLLGAAVEQPIDACKGVAPGGGIGMAISIDQGLLATGQPACEGRGAGATFLAFAQNGAVLDVKTFAGAGADFSLAAVHALAAGRARNSFELAYVSAGTAYRLSLLGARPQDGFVSLFPSMRPGFAQLATSSEAVAYLVGSPNVGGEVLFGVGPWDAEPSVIKSGGALGAVAVHGGQAIAATASSGELRWEGRASDGSFLGEGALPVEAVPTALDVAIVGEEAIIVGGWPGKILLASIGQLRAPLASQPREVSEHGPALGGASLAAYDGRNLAMASARDGFAITWLSSRLGEGSAGGFAVFECAKQ